MSEKLNATVAEKRQKRKKNRRNYLRALWSTIRTLIFIALLAMVAAHYFFPVMRIHTDGMSPALDNGDIVVALKGEQWQPGDMIAFYFNDKLMVKRVIAVAGDVIFIDENGTVQLNGQLLDEPYVSVADLGECDLEMPYTVPNNRVFVMGDQRQISLDSRSSAIGCIAQEQIIGRVILRIWPLEKMDIY